MTDAVAVDAEPLVAYYWDEPGAEDVEAVIDDVERGTVRGWINTVTCTEVRYVCGRDDAEKARQYVSRIRDWFGVVTAEDVWERAAAYKQEWPLALGDAFTLATALDKDAVAYCGADDDFDDLDVEVRRFREAGV
ncbi:MAG: PIN domain-containing protein [Haloarcula sp.]|jgi:PIN domain.